MENLLQFRDANVECMDSEVLKEVLAKLYSTYYQLIQQEAYLPKQIKQLEDVLNELGGLDKKEFDDEDQKTVYASNWNLYQQNLRASKSSDENIKSIEETILYFKKYL